MATRFARSGTLRGLTVTGGVITAAGSILAATFAALAQLPSVSLTEVGTAMPSTENASTSPCWAMGSVSESFRVPMMTVGLQPSGAFVAR